MAEQFIAYIDESGDEGYEFAEQPNRKCSEWFVLSAAIIRSTQNAVLDRRLGGAFHFQKAPHHACVNYAETVSHLPITAISVFFNKRLVPDDAAIRNRKHYLFDYSCKLLFERISWYCDEHPERGNVKIIFSHRRQLKLERLRAYLHRLSDGDLAGSEHPDLVKSSIRWRVVDLDMLDVKEHDSLPGLRAADCLASGCARAVEYSKSNNTEHRFVKIFKRKFYKRGTRTLSYGLKFMPKNATEKDDPLGSSRFHWLHHFN